MKVLKNERQRCGFSLIEILTVMTIISILGGIGFGTYMLVNRNARVTQAELMIENLSSSLESRVNERFSDAEERLVADLLDGNSSYPEGDGSTSSTKKLYGFLSGDYDMSGTYQEDEGSPAFPQLDPNYQGKGRYLNDDLEIVDPWKTPLRYKFDEDGIGLNNNVEGGFDIWSAGPDQTFDTEDDINNW